VNRLHQALSPSQKRRFFYLSIDLPCRVEGPWTVDFAGRRLVLPLHRDFDLAWAAATTFRGHDTELHELYEALVRAAGFGRRNICDGCGEPILTTQVEYEYMVDDDVTYRFHIDCAGLWHTELERRGLG
jgi:hypothetical protein